LNLEGWTPPQGNEGNWTVSSGNIVHNGEGGDLWTTESFGDFDLVCDWRWVGESQGPRDRPVINPDGSNATNDDGTPRTVRIEERDSGIYLRGSSTSQVNIWCWPVGSGEVYGYRTNGNLPPEVRAGVTPRHAADAQVGQWNRFFIRMRGDRLTVVLNGVAVIEDAQLPGVKPSGRIALQSHHSGIEFTNVLIRRVD
jgi:hypothetical protein